MYPTIFLFVFTEIHAFYLPGVAPREYKVGEKVELKASTQILLSYIKLTC